MIIRFLVPKNDVAYRQGDALFDLSIFLRQADQLKTLDQIIGKGGQILSWHESKRLDCIVYLIWLSDAVRAPDYKECWVCKRGGYIDPNCHVCGGDGYVQLLEG